MMKSVLTTVIGAAAVLMGASSLPTIANIYTEPPTMLGKVLQGTERVSLPPDAVLTNLRLGKEAKRGPRWLDVGYAAINGGPLKLGAEYALPTITAPASHGGSAYISVPEGSIVTSIKLGDEALTVWYRPSNLKFEGQVEGPGTKEPKNDGGGTDAYHGNRTMSGFQWMKDKDGTLGLRITYRKILPQP